ncbi:phosphotransferase family protein [Nocardioides bruguierae]|uniref:Aminoglycoside phosphotransferase family protein n=1 Tax=Nocardioides bruguierae TaxID=2945102 RepID=A0A9X2D9Y4_9ACTN|nr:phosphotransferase [Nocardioides bruguierae]MCM0621871.1 aminoglycoside phosphotransferase family protein [Nocardioides bruguierae]
MLPRSPLLDSPSGDPLEPEEAFDPFDPWSVEGVPHGRTVRRVEWGFLPRPVRTAVETRLGSPVVEAHSASAGWTAGLASSLVCADGSTHFVKAASLRAQPAFAAAHRAEASVLGVLTGHAGVPAPALRWSTEVDEWVLLGLEDVEGRLPSRPWTRPDLTAVLDSLATSAEVLPAAASALERAGVLTDLADDLSDWPLLVPLLSGLREDLAPERVWERVADAAAVLASAVTGDALVHGDLRDDNLLLADDGRVVWCDWPWAARGAAWADLVWLLTSAATDPGLDPEPLLRAHPLAAGVEDEAVDALLAGTAGYLLTTAERKPPATSPFLRRHQRQQGEAALAWLRARRDW